MVIVIKNLFKLKQLFMLSIFFTKNCFHLSNKIHHLDPGLPVILLIAHGTLLLKIEIIN